MNSNCPQELQIYCNKNKEHLEINIFDVNLLNTENLLHQ